MWRDSICALLAAAAAAIAQTSTAPAAPAAGQPPYSYFVETGLSYDYYGKTLASTTGFGVRFGSSNAFLVTDIDTPVGGTQATDYATLRAAIEYHVAVAGLWEFLGLGASGVTSNGTTTVASFAGGVGLSCDLVKLLSKGKYTLPVVAEYRIVAITAAQVKPTYQFSFRKTF